MRSTYILASAALVAVATMSTAQTITSRLSTQNFNSVYGGGPDVFQPNDFQTSGAMLSADTRTMSFSDSKSGFILGDPQRPWSAAVGLALSHTYAISGPLSSFSQISASGSSMATAAAGGEGLANIFAQTPGNELMFEFNAAAGTIVRLAGSVDLNPNGQNLSAGVALQRWDGFFWQNTFNSIFLPGQEGDFDNTFNLEGGQYRILGTASVNAFAGVRPFQENTWNYQLTVVPEPGTMAAIGLGVAALIRRRRSNR